MKLENDEVLPTVAFKFKWRRYIVEQGLVLMGGYIGTAALQALSCSAVWSGLSIW